MPDWMPNQEADRIGDARVASKSRRDLASAYTGPVLSGDEYWSADFARRGVWGEVYTIGENTADLVIGGRFAFAGSTSARNIARWDGVGWQAYGDGVGVTPDNWGEVSAIIQYGGYLIAGGNLRKAGQDTVVGVQAAYWDGTTWHAMDYSEFAGQIYDFAVYQGQLYAGGTFWNAQGYQGLLVWDGSSWQPLGAPFPDAWDLLIRDDKLLVAATSKICVWDGASWSQPYGELADGGFLCLADWNGTLVGGGDVMPFGHEGQRVGGHVWTWSGTSWQELGGGLFGWYSGGLDMSRVETLAVHAGLLYAGGRFELTSIGGADVSVPYAAMWAGARWVSLGGGATNRISKMAEFGSNLVVGGYMGYVGNVNIPAHTGDLDVWGIATWDGTNWHAYGPSGLGLNAMVHCLGLYDNRLIAAGPFTRAGEASVKGIAQFDGTSWTGLGGGLEYSSYYFQTCQSMVEFNGDLIVGGNISRAGDIPVQNVARWNGQQWSAMGGGISLPSATYDFPIGLGVHAGELYAERYRWTGTDWVQAFPVDGTISCYRDWNGLLVFGGAFQHLGSLAVNYIAAWDGTNFIPLGDGLPGGVTSLAVYGDRLVAGGQYPYFISSWNGTSWQNLGFGVDGWVQCLASQGNDVFAGGYFAHMYNAPGQALQADHVAYWDGTMWHSLGSGCGGAAIYREDVLGVLLFQGYLYAAGDFGFAGNRPSWFIGRWRDPAVPVYMRYFSAQRSGQTVVLRCELGEASPDRLEIWRTSPGETRVLLGQMANAGSTSVSFTDRSPPAGEADYWLREVNAAGTDTWLGSAHLAAAQVPALLTLAPCAPNPFNPKTTIRYSLPRAAHVRLVVYDQRGRIVRTLVDGSRTAGEQSAAWDGQDGQGRPAPSGNYIVRLVTAQGTRSSKLTLAR